MLDLIADGNFSAAQGMRKDYICTDKYNKELSETVDMLRNAVEYKGIEQFDYILREQSDEHIDNDKLTEDFFSMYDKLDLLYTEEAVVRLEERKNKNIEI